MCNIAISPCTCSGQGIPYVEPYEHHTHDYELYLIRCYNCQTIGPIEFTENLAVEKWNKINNYTFKE